MSYLFSKMRDSCLHLAARKNDGILVEYLLFQGMSCMAKNKVSYFYSFLCILSKAAHGPGRARGCGTSDRGSGLKC